MVFTSGMDPYRYEGNKNDYLNEAISKNKSFRLMINALAMKFLLSSDWLGLKGLFKYSPGDYFTDSYFNSTIYDGERAQAEQIKAHTAVRRICENKNVDIYNATRGGELEVYERLDVCDII